VLRRIFGPKRDEVTGEWRRLHNKKLYALYSSPDVIRVIKSRRLRWAGHVARMGRREVHTGLQWGNLREGCSRVWMGGIDWIDLAQDRNRWRSVVYTVMNLRVA
jgi:hypothetical protein